MGDDKVYKELVSNYKKNNLEGIYSSFKEINNINSFFLSIVDDNFWKNHILSYIIMRKDVFDTTIILYNLLGDYLKKLIYEFEIPLRKLKGKELLEYVKLLETNQFFLKVISITKDEDYTDLIRESYLRKDNISLSVYVKIVIPDVMAKALYEPYYQELKDYVEKNGIEYNDIVGDILLNVHNPYMFLTYLIKNYKVFADNIKYIVYKNENAMKIYTTYYIDSIGFIKDYLIDLFILYFSDYKIVNISSLVKHLKSNNVYYIVVDDIAYNEKYNPDFLPFPGYSLDENVKRINDDIQKTLYLYNEYDLIIDEIINKLDNIKSNSLMSDAKSLLQDISELINSINNINKFFDYSSDIEYLWSFNTLIYAFIESQKYSNSYFEFVLTNTKNTKENMIQGIVSYINYYSYDKIDMTKLNYVKDKLISYGLFNYIQNTICEEFDHSFFKAIEREDKTIINFLNSMISLDCKKRLAKYRKIAKIENEIIKNDNKEFMPILTPVFENIVFKFLNSKKYIKEAGTRILIGNRIYIVNYDYYLRSVYYIIRNKFYAENIIEDLIFSKSSNINCMLKDDYVYYLGDKDYSYHDHNNRTMKMKIDNVANIPGNVLDYIYYSIYKNLTNCKDGFKLYSIYKKGESIGHRIVTYFENINDTITIYYYDPHGNENTTSRDLNMYIFFEFITDCMNYISKTYNYKYKFKFEQFFSGCPIGLQAYSSNFDIGMCQTFTLFWLYNIVQIKNFIRDIKYINEIPMSKLIPRIEEYYSTNLTDYELYNLLISFLSEFTNEFLSKNEKINKVLSKKILDQLEIEYSSRGKDDTERIKIYNLKDKEVRQEQENITKYKEKIKEQDFKVKNKINFIVTKQIEDQIKIYKDEEERIKNKSGKKLIEFCDYDLDCASECCVYNKKHNEQVCSPNIFCKERHEKRGLSGLKN